MIAQPEQNILDIEQLLNPFIQPTSQKIHFRNRMAFEEKVAGKKKKKEQRKNKPTYIAQPLDSMPLNHRHKDLFSFCLYEM